MAIRSSVPKLHDRLPLRSVMRQGRLRRIVVGEYIIYVRGTIGPIVRKSIRPTSSMKGGTTSSQQIRDHVLSPQVQGQNGSDHAESRLDPLADLVPVPSPVLSVEDQNMIAELLLKPPPPAPALQRAMENHKRYVRQSP